MTKSALRVLAAVAVSAVAYGCLDRVSGISPGRLAAVHLAPSFAQRPAGGPDIDVTRMNGVLRHGTDSVFAEATIQGDSAILEFQRVQVTGDSTKYELQIRAFDAANVQVFQALQDLQIKPGNNPPVEAVLLYSAPDTAVATVDIAETLVTLDWAGSDPSSSCVHKATIANPVRQKALAVTAQNAAGQAISGVVRVGWTARDTSVVTVDEAGVVRSRCSVDSTWVVARTFLNKADSVKVKVNAPPFSMVVTPDSANVARGDSVRLQLLAVDENDNRRPADGVIWQSSDPSRATVSATGWVKGIANGRVLITGNASNRTATAVVKVVRPRAKTVAILPRADTVLVGQYSTFFARALDSLGRVIGDATEFTWLSRNTSVATMSGSTAKALSLGPSYILAKIDNAVDSVPFTVAATRPTGAVEGLIKDASTDLGIAGVTVAGPGGSTTTEASGAFLLAGLNNGDDVTVSKTGYVGVTVYSVPVYANDTLRIPASPLVPTSTAKGTMTGRVVNALIAKGVSGVTIKAYKGINAAPSAKRPEVQPNYTATSTTDGLFTISDADPGAYTFVATGAGYSETISVGIAIGGTTKNNGDIILPPSANGGGMYVVLTWGGCGSPGVPCDLDAHLTGPQVGSPTARFHVNGAARAYVAGDTIAALDVVDATGPGPEVMSIRPSAEPGVFRFYVHDKSNAANAASTALSATSGARVDIYMNNRVVATFFPPASQTGTLWKVFEWDGARLTQAGTIVYQADVGTLP